MKRAATTFASIFSKVCPSLPDLPLPSPGLIRQTTRHGGVLLLGLWNLFRLAVVHWPRAPCGCRLARQHGGVTLLIACFASRSAHGTPAPYRRVCIPEPLALFKTHTALVRRWTPSHGCPSNGPILARVDRSEAMSARSATRLDVLPLCASRCAASTCSYSSRLGQAAPHECRQLLLSMSAALRTLPLPSPRDAD